MPIQFQLLQSSAPQFKDLGFSFCMVLSLSRSFLPTQSAGRWEINQCGESGGRVLCMKPENSIHNFLLFSIGQNSAIIAISGESWKPRNLGKQDLVNIQHPFCHINRCCTEEETVFLPVSLALKFVECGIQRGGYVTVYTQVICSADYNKNSSKVANSKGFQFSQVMEYGGRQSRTVAAARGIKHPSSFQLPFHCAYFWIYVHCPQTAALSPDIFFLFK